MFRGKIKMNRFYIVKLFKNIHVAFLAVTESEWTDVFEAAIGGQRTRNDHEVPRVPSAYLLVYINSDSKTSSHS